MGHIQCGRNILCQLVGGGRNILRNYQGDPINSLIYAGHGIRYRKLEVILTTTVDKLGKAGETVKVAPGYFRNHLMPKMLAVPNIDKFARLIAEQRKLYQREETVETVKDVSQTEEDKIKEYQAAANRLTKACLVLKRHINVNNDIRSPVTKEELVEEVARQLCVAILPENLYLSSALTTLGEFEIPLLFPKSLSLPEGKVQWSLNVKIRRK